MNVPWPAVILLCWLIIALSAESSELVAVPDISAEMDEGVLPDAGDDFSAASASTDTTYDTARGLDTESVVSIAESTVSPTQLQAHEDAGSGGGSSINEPPGGEVSPPALPVDDISHELHDTENVASQRVENDEGSVTVTGAVDRAADATSAAATDAAPAAPSPAEAPIAAEPPSIERPSALTEPTGVEASSATERPAEVRAAETKTPPETASDSSIASPTEVVAASLRRWCSKRCSAVRSHPALSRVAASARPFLQRSVAVASSLVARARRHRALLGGLVALALFAHRVALLL